MGWLSAQGMAAAFLEGQGKKMGSKVKEVAMASLSYARVLEGRSVSLMLLLYQLTHPSSAGHHCSCSFQSSKTNVGALQSAPSLLPSLAHLLAHRKRTWSQPYTWEAATYATFTSSVLQASQMSRHTTRFGGDGKEKIAKMLGSSCVVSAVEGIFAIWTLSAFSMKCSSCSLGPV